MAAAFLLAALAIQGADDGFCAGPAWIALQPQETLIHDAVPDAALFHVEAGGLRRWSVYLGRAAYPVEDARAPLTTVDQLAVHPATSPGEFEGYLVRLPDGRALHFHGRAFADAPPDRSFFDRVAFASPRCSGRAR